MNINLSAAASKKKKKADGGELAFGLNQQKANVFGGDESSSEDEESIGGRRKQVNRDLQQEQDALRKRAAAAVYDFDGTYEETKQQQRQVQQPNKKKESRYIGDLLENAKRRKLEMDMAHERKIAKEQADEEAEFGPKERFITSAYKKKLAERQAWTQEQEEQQEREEREDVTKMTGSAAMAGFYGNLNRNVAMGGGGEEQQKRAALSKEEDRKQGADKDEPSNKPSGDVGFLDGFERATDKSFDAAAAAKGNDTKDKPEPAATKESATPAEPTRTPREIREEKVAQARIRYFKRRGITQEEASRERQ